MPKIVYSVNTIYVLDNLRFKFKLIHNFRLLILLDFADFSKE
jgi:hypothetical protein